MDINTLIDNIKYSIASGENKKIQIREESCLLDVLGENDDKGQGLSEDSKSVSWWKLIGAYYAQHLGKPWNNWTKSRFPLSKLIVKTILFFLQIIIYTIYLALRGLRCLILGQKYDKDLSCSPRLNFVIFISVVVLYIVAVICVFVFFIKSVLLFDVTKGATDQGALMTQLDCGREQYMYLFNTAKCWSNTGIKVLEGDEIEISASGSFYSSIKNMYDCAKKNTVLKYPRSVVSHDKSKGADSKSISRSLWMYHDDNTADSARFGSLLLQIKEENEEFSYNSGAKNLREIIQLNISENKKQKLIVEKSGMLYFAVNDIYLSDSVISTIVGEDGAQIRELLGIDSLYAKFSTKTDSVLRLNRTMWFDDNVGEMLLNINIIRNTLAENSFRPTFIVKEYRNIDEWLKTFSCFSCLKIALWFCIVLLWLIFDYYLSKHAYKLLVKLFSVYKTDRNTHK